ncbi:hypothetical protein ACAX43_19050 [Paraburkholderia sp. IW21]|uniref:hypothetical protein n=1 Tax=Paraburkholderia sp. IW21 TaxID=3242488 RepID=UPI003521CE2F
MSKPDFITDLAIFLPLWERAHAGREKLAGASSAELLYFDSVDISTQRFFELIRALLAFKDASDFATLVLKPDPFSYFHFHFHKYPGFVHRAEHSDDDFFESWQKDPGDSPADCLWANSERYAVLPIPGEWFVYADRKWEMGVLSGPPDIVAFARSFYPFFFDPGEEFIIVK